jgi:shikimate kinase
LTAPARPGRTGRGLAHGAVTIVNATATGIGCSLAVEGGASATWEPSGAGSAVTLRPAGDDSLVQAVAAELAGRLPDRGAVVEVTCASPPSRGLKTSSSVGAALVRAAGASAGLALADTEVESLAVAASRRAGVTLTGALDDQVATVRGGCHVTDNKRGEVLHALPIEPWAVAIWVPHAAIRKDRLRGVDLGPAVAGARAAAELATQGRLGAAMTENGRAFTPVYAAAGLPVDERPAQVALEHGALGAGLSGTGPAVAALFDRPLDLQPVPGGTWRWTKAVPAR